VTCVYLARRCYVLHAHPGGCYRKPVSELQSSQVWALNHSCDVSYLSVWQKSLHVRGHVWFAAAPPIKRYMTYNLKSAPYLGDMTSIVHSHARPQSWCLSVVKIDNCRLVAEVTFHFGILYAGAVSTAKAFKGIQLTLTHTQPRVSTHRERAREIVSLGAREKESAIGMRHQDVYGVAHWVKVFVIPSYRHTYSFKSSTALYPARVWIRLKMGEGGTGGANDNDIVKAKGFGEDFQASGSLVSNFFHTRVNHWKHSDTHTDLKHTSTHALSASFRVKALSSTSQLSGFKLIIGHFKMSDTGLKEKHKNWNVTEQEPDVLIDVAFITSQEIF